MKNRHIWTRQLYFLSAAICFFLVVAVAISLKFYYSNKDFGSCKEMEKVALDGDKIFYIRSKVMPFYGSEELKDALGGSKYLDKSFHPLVFDKLGIDWEYIGLPEYFVQIYFHGEMFSENEYKSIRLVYGRAAIFIDLEEGGYLSNYTRDQESSFKEVAIRDGVSVFCPK